MSVTSGYGFPSHFTSHSPSQRRTHDYRASRKARVHVYVHALDAACLDIDQGAMCSGFFFLEEHVGETLGAAQKHSIPYLTLRL